MGIYPEKMKTLIWKDPCTPIFIAALFTITKKWKQPICPSTDEWIKKNVAHIHNEVLAIKNNEIMPICRNMDGPRDHHTKWSKSDKDKYYMISLICGVSKRDTNELTNQKQKRTHRKPTYGY